jgi:hypothetical protein
MSLTSINQMVFAIEKWCVFFQVQAKFLNIFLTSFSFKLNVLECESC